MLCKLTQTRSVPEVATMIMTNPNEAGSSVISKNFSPKLDDVVTLTSIAFLRSYQRTGPECDLRLSCCEQLL